jgi:hypothetical protein
VRKIYRTCSIDPVRPASGVDCGQAIDVCRVSPTIVFGDPTTFCYVAYLRGSVICDGILPDSYAVDYKKFLAHYIIYNVIIISLLDIKI